MKHLILTFLAISVSCDAAPRILAIFAHPDDEVSFAGAAYAMTHELCAEVDVVIVTNGEGGYKYSTLAEPIYGLKLTNEEVGRAHLPGIRKKEALRGGAILGVRRYYFLDQQDHRYTRDMSEVFNGVWDIPLVRCELQRLICRGYDFLIVMLPTEETHGHHKAASVLALEAASTLPQKYRPIAIGASLTAVSYRGLPDAPVTNPSQAKPIATFDRTQTFGFKERLDYQIIVNWFLAEHKSQGTAQQLMGKNDCEFFYSFALNDEDGIAKAVTLFAGLGSKASTSAPNT